MTNELVYYNAARSALQQAASVDEVKDIKDKAEAIRLYAQQQKDSALEQYAAQIKTRAMRRLGELSKELDKAQPTRTGVLLASGGKLKSQALKDAGLSTSTAHRCERLASIPEKEFEAFIQGTPQVTTILKEVRTEEIKQEREELKKCAQENGDLWSVEHADISTYNTPKTFDYIITDPPYLKEYIEIYSTLSLRAQEWLKPDGMLIAMCGQSYLDTIYARMAEHLDYYWTACYLTPGQPTPLRTRQVNTTWKPLLCFVPKGAKYTGRIFGDVFKSDGNDKSLHKWGQSESGMESIVSGICLAGQSVFDPFCGAGTTGIAALKHGCFFHGIDNDIEQVRLAQGRLASDAKEKRCA